jgi:hypothetical protein
MQGAIGRALRPAAIAVVVAVASGAVADDVRAAEPSPLGRFLLVAAEGLYIVEPHLSCSWSYTFPPPVRQTLTQYDDMVSDGHVLGDGRIVYAANRYIREIDRDKRTIWEYRVEAPAEVKTCCPVGTDKIAIVHSGEQAILELERGTGKVLRRIPVPAQGTEHTRYNLLRATPQGTYLLALRTENRFTEVDRDGKELRSFKVVSLPVVARRLADGSTLCAARIEVTRYDPAGAKAWSYTRVDAAADFPMIIAGGNFTLADGRLAVVNSDWHYPEKDRNRVQVFVVDEAKRVSWTLPATAFAPWKRSWTEKKTGLVEHRVLVIQPLGKPTPDKSAPGK